MVDAYVEGGVTPEELADVAGALKAGRQVVWDPLIVGGICSAIPALLSTAIYVIKRRV